MPRLTIPAVGKYGIIKDRPPQELPHFAWSDAMNVRFHDGMASAFGGSKQVFVDTSAPVVWIQQYNQGGKRWWIHATATGVYADDGISTRLDITPSGMTASPGNTWTGGVLGGVLIANNGTNAPYYWAGSGVMQPVTNWPAGYVAGAIRPFKNYLIAINITKSGTEYPHLVLWSNEAEPGTLPTSWDVNDKTENAGDSPAMAQDPSLAIDLLPMGDAMLVYKENAVYSMTLSGTDYIFNIEPLPVPGGMMGRNCIASTPKGHMVVMPGDVILHNGSSYQQIANGRVREWLFKNIDSTSRSRMFTTTNPRFNEVWVCFPELTRNACTRALVWNWNDDTWSLRSLPNITFGAVGQVDKSLISVINSDHDLIDNDHTLIDEDEMSPAQMQLIMGGVDGLFAVDLSDEENGESFDWFMERTGISFDDTAGVKVAREVWPRITAAAGNKVQIQAGATMNVEQSVAWGSPVTYTVAGSGKASIPFPSGRFLAMRFASIDKGATKIVSFDVDWSQRGKY